MWYRKTLTALFCIFSFSAFGGVSGLIKFGLRLGDSVKPLANPFDKRFLRSDGISNSVVMIVTKRDVLDGSAKSMRGIWRPDLVPGMGGDIADKIPKSQMKKFVGNWISDGDASGHSILVVRQKSDDKFVIQTTPDYPDMHFPGGFDVDISEFQISAAKDGGAPYWRRDVVINTEDWSLESQKAYRTDALVLDDPSRLERYVFTREGDRMVYGRQVGGFPMGFQRLRRMTDEEIDHFLGEEYRLIHTDAPPIRNIDF